MAGFFTLRNFVLFLAVPALALFVAGRQLYLSSNYNLSTWKGGGMGMFASADLLGRYMRVFIETPDKQRIIVRDLAPGQVKLLHVAKIFPSDENFKKVGASLRTARFSASREPIQSYRFDQTGKSLGASNTKYIVATALNGVSGGKELGLPIILELWQLSYDPENQRVRTQVLKSMRVEPSGDQNNAPETGSVPKL